MCSHVQLEQRKSRIIQDEEETLLGYNPLCSKVVSFQFAFCIFSRVARYVLATSVRWGVMGDKTGNSSERNDITSELMSCCLPNGLVFVYFSLDASQYVSRSPAPTRGLADYFISCQSPCMISLMICFHI